MPRNDFAGAFFFFVLHFHRPSIAIASPLLVSQWNYVILLLVTKRTVLSHDPAQNRKTMSSRELWP